MLFIEGAYRFLEYLKVLKDASPHTLRNYAIDLNAFKSFLEEEWQLLAPLPPKIEYAESYQSRKTLYDHKLPLKEISRQSIRHFLKYLQKQNCHKRTIARRLSALKSLFKYLMAHSLIDTNPLEDIKAFKTGKRLPITLTYEQINLFFQQPDISTLLGFRDRTIMELFYSSALRLSELVGLNQEDFNKEEHLLRIRGKGKKERVTPLTENAAHWIKSYLSHPDRTPTREMLSSTQGVHPIFLNHRGERLTARSIDRMFATYLKQSGLNLKITPHIIRHAIATHWLEKGMDLKSIQFFLGHASLSTTTIYTHVSQKLKKETYDKTHPRHLISYMGN